MNVQLRLEQRVDVVLHPAASIRGVVVHPDRSPSGGARVFAREESRALGDVTALGARSIGAVIDEAPIGTSTEVRKANGATRTIPSVAPRAKSSN